MDGEEIVVSGESLKRGLTYRAAVGFPIGLLLLLMQSPGWSGEDGSSSHSISAPIRLEEEWLGLDGQFSPVRHHSRTLTPGKEEESQD
jgi:hypothetical protein